MPFKTALHQRRMQNELLDMFERISADGIRTHLESGDEFRLRPRERATKTRWTDEMFLKKGQRHCEWKEIPEYEFQGHLVSFLNLWFSKSGFTASSIGMWNVIRNVVLMIPLGTSDKLLLGDVFDSANENAVSPPDVNNQETCIYKVTNGLSSTEKDDAIALYKWLYVNFLALESGRKKLEQGQPKSRVYNIASHNLRATFGFCALVLLRLMTKDERQIEEYFIDNNLTEKFNSLFPEVRLPVRLVKPTPILLRTGSAALSKTSRSRSCINLLHLLVFQYLKSVSRNDTSSILARKILEEGCLKDMEGNGMGLIKMFQDVKLKYSYIEERLLLSIIDEGDRSNTGMAMFDGDHHSCERLIEFLDTYAQKSKPQHSWKWARILYKHYFDDMNIRKNKTLCSKFAALLIDDNPHIIYHKDLKDEFIGRYGEITGGPMSWAETAKKNLQELNDDLKQIAG